MGECLSPFIYRRGVGLSIGFRSGSRDVAMGSHAGCHPVAMGVRCPLKLNGYFFASIP